MRGRAGLTLLLAIISLMLLGTADTALAWGVNHPDQCVACHGSNTLLTTDEASGQQAWDHIVVTGDPAWEACSRCHTSIATNVANSVHQALTCKGCHAVLHVGVYDGTIYTAGIFTYEVNTTGARMLSPNPANLVRKALLLTEANATTYYPNITNLLALATDGKEVEVGGWDSLSNQFVEVTPLGINDNAYRICFSCHFLAQNPAEVGAYRIVDGRWVIGIPESALSMDPHVLLPMLPSDSGLNVTEDDAGGGFALVGVVLASLIAAARRLL